MWRAVRCYTEHYKRLHPHLPLPLPLPSLLRSVTSLLAFSSSSSSPSPSSYSSSDAKAIFADPAHPPYSSPAVDFIPTLLQPRVVVYDGVCHLCHSGVKWVIKADRHEKIKFCCLQSKAAEPYLRFCGADREDVLRRFIFIEGPEAYYQASTAALKVLSYLPFPYSALSAFLMIPAPVRDIVYDYVASRRYNWFGRQEECIVMQEKEMLDRFIDRDELLSKDGEKPF